MSDKIERIIDALRKKILEEAIRGNLVPQNPEDEPASVLLQRIEAERERLIKEKKIKRPKSVSKIVRRDGHFYESINGGEPVCIDDDIPFEIPDSWVWVNLFSICFPKQWKTISTQELTETGFPVYGANGLIGYYSSYNHDRRTILITCRGATCGAINVCKPYSYVNGNAMALDDLSEKVVFEYIELFLQGINYETIITGSAQPQITQQSLLKLYIAIPPLAEQHRIIEKVNKHAEIFTELTIARQRYKHILSETPTSLRQQLIQAAIQGKLVPQEPSDEPASELLKRIAEERVAKLGKKAAKSATSIVRRGSKTYELFPDGSGKDISDEIPFEIPDDWVWCRLSSLCSFLSRGKSPKYSETEKLYPVFAQKCNLKEGGISLKKARFLDPKTVNKWKEEYKLQNSDILINSTGTGTVCRTRIFNEACLGAYPFTVPDSHVTVVRTYPEIKSFFIYAYIDSGATQQYLEEHLSGSTNQKELYIGVLEDLLIPLPPKQEQHRIVEKLGALLKLI